MHNLAKLTWQCRRGTRELDYLLTCYLETLYLHADPIEQQQFQQLLALEDNTLLALFFNATSIAEELTQLVEKIHHAAIICD